jgi:integrase
MAEPLQMKNGKFRMLVRQAGVTRCKTFVTKAAATKWAREIEREIDQLKSVGFLQPKGLTFGDMVDRYIREVYPNKPWGRSKAADLARLKLELGQIPVANLTHEKILSVFVGMNRAGAGGVTISSRAGYLIAVLETARDVWRLNVPVEAARSARKALATIGLIRKSRCRERRVTDSEIQRIVDHLGRKVTTAPLADVIWFSVASAMRISETCRLEWRDLNEIDRTIRIRDRKHPTAKIGNHQIVPLLEDVAGHNAYDLIKKQPKRGKRIFRLNPKTVGTYFTKAVQQLKIEDLHLHDLRHEAISRLFESGYSIQQVSVVSGHRDWSMLKRYTHLRAVDLHPKKAAA